MASHSPSNAGGVVIPAWPEGCPPVLWDDYITEDDFGVLGDMLLYGWYMRPSGFTGPCVWTYRTTQVGPSTAAYWATPPELIIVVSLDSSARRRLQADGGYIPFGDDSIPMVLGGPSRDVTTCRFVMFRNMASKESRESIHPFLDTENSKKWRSLPWALIALSLVAK